MDEIRIVDLEVFANHGVFPEENALGQKFIVNLVLRGDFFCGMQKRCPGRFRRLWRGMPSGRCDVALIDVQAD